MSFENKEVTLLTWSATTYDPGLLENTIKLLSEKYEYITKRVIYLYHNSKKLDAVKEFLSNQKIALESIEIPLKDPTDHDDILKGMLETLKKASISKWGDTCINISAGTPAMNAIWMALMTMGYFEHAKYFNVQKLPTSSESITPASAIKEVKLPLPKSHHEAIVRYKLDQIETLSYSTNEEGGILEEAKAKLKKYCQKSNMPILILGERGIGKSNIVDTCVREWKKKNIIVSENCGAWDDQIAGPEIFGSTKNAYTGATNREGCLKKAKGGVLFLDEVHHLSPKWQRELLRTLQDDKHSYKVLGEDKIQKAPDTDFVFASNLSLKQLKQTLFADFFDRISFFIIELPPLRNDKKNIKKHWESVWKTVREKTKTTNSPDDVWCKALQDHLHEDKNLMGNFRSLQVIAYNLLVEEPWDENKRINTAKIEDILNHIAERNEPVEAEDNLLNYRGESDSLPYQKEFKKKGWEYSWAAAKGMFCKELAQKICEKYGTPYNIARDKILGIKDKKTLTSAMDFNPISIKKSY